MAEMKYKAGTIKSLKLINFMCHESFELFFGPRVNFVIGPNGSGKSALLTALVVVLGGRATATSRAKRANDFVMYGKNFARIICVLHNYDRVMDKDDAFKPDYYGKEIIIEKTIYKDEASSKLILKNDKDKKVSERKQELDDMLEHFGILINNPICILNQEISKTFLHSKRPEDKYDLFMKATTLEQIEQDYHEATDVHGKWKECNSSKSAGFKLLDSEYAQCKEKINFLMNRVKLQDRHLVVGQELVWAVKRDLEASSDRMITDIAEIETKIEDSNTDIMRREEKIDHAKQSIETLNSNIQSCNEDCELSKKKTDAIRKREYEARSKKISIDGEIESLRRRIARFEKDKASLEKAISEIHKQNENENLTQGNELKKLELEALLREKASEQAREKNIRQHTDQLSKSMTEIRQQFHQLTLKIGSLQQEISTKEALLRRLRGGQENELRKYGDFMVKVCDAVERAHKVRKFKVKPLGPLGRYIKLKSEDVAAALEVHLGRNAHAFVCDNVHDMQVLHKIIRDLKGTMNIREPIVLTRRFCQRHDVSRFKAHHDRYLTMLDYIDVDEPAVYNALVDRNFLESVLFIPDHIEAENLMITASLVPKGTRCAYTKDCFVMHPRTAHGGYRSVANNYQNLCLFSKGNSDMIAETERGIRDIQMEINCIEQNTKRLQENLNAQRMEFDSNQNEIRAIIQDLRGKERHMLTLQTALSNTNQPEEVDALNGELEACSKSIVEMKQTVEKHLVDLSAIEQELLEITSERRSIAEVSTKREELRQSVLKKITQQSDLIKSHQDAIERLRTTINNLTKKKLEDESKLKGTRELLDAKKKELTGIQKPKEIGSTEELRNELKKIQQQLNTEIEENEDPERLQEIIRKRMDEIESLQNLRDLNTDNFVTTETALKAREEGFRTLRSMIITNVSGTFGGVMRAMGMNGMMRIHTTDLVHQGEVVAKAKTLEMSIDTTPSQRPAGAAMVETSNIDEEATTRRRSIRSQPNPEVSRPKRPRLDESTKENQHIKMTDTRSLSGGERSFSTVAFVLALWHHCSSPFKLMDEIDVFMDMVTRRLSYNSLIKFAQAKENPGQFIFFSPLELPKIDDGQNMVRVFEMPQIIRKGVQSQIPSTSRETS